MSDRKADEIADTILTWLKVVNAGAKLTAALDAVHTSQRDPLRFIQPVK
jgi:hypothetical protein